uniref:Tissue factor pathway inhibitor-1 n=1 Tax=Schmidtea mediterranea TaxID=79327 RepID=I1ZIG7_SCHMD|nr:tissue factor pathway inhibitor-1 [Schmidtea mediterranea]
MCKAYIPRYFYNDTSEKCERFIYGGCGANGNNFKTLKDCQDLCEERNKQNCEDPLAKGFCKAYIPRYFYNDTSEKCERFIYGGCGANGNNFKILKDCQDFCEETNSD